MRTEREKDAAEEQCGEDTLQQEQAPLAFATMRTVEEGAGETRTDLGDGWVTRNAPKACVTDVRH
jgi:hypothetical protein